MPDEDIFDIIIANPAFWIIFSISFGYPIYKKITSPDKFRWLEFIMQFFGGLFALFVVYMTFFITVTDIMNIQTMNTKVAKVEYHEPWTEVVIKRECSGSGESRSCTLVTEHVHHPAQYFLFATNGHIQEINTSIYENYRHQFGAKKEFVSHLMQSSIGDGNKYISTPTIEIPMAYQEGYIDYIKGSHLTILKEQYRTQFKEFDSKIIPYPKIMDTPYGTIDSPRIVGDLNLISGLTAPIETALDKLNMSYGEKMHCNIIVYITGEQNHKFVDAVLNKWNAPRQNDIIIFVSLDKNQTIRWATVKAFTKHELFKKELERKINALEYFTPNIVATIASQIKQPKKNEDGFLRQHMQEYEYLRSNITLPWYWNLTILIIFIMGHIAIAKYYEENDPFEIEK